MKSCVKTKTFKLALAVITALCAMLLTGCGASLTVFDYTSNGVHYNDYELSVDAQTVAKMESSAAVDDSGRPYTVAGYFYELFDIAGFSLVSSTLDANGYFAVFRKSYKSGADPELYTLGTRPNLSIEYKDGPFIRRIKRTAPNPFNGVRDAYDAIENPMSANTLLELVKNGRCAYNEFGEVVVQFPSVTAAFPYLKGADIDGFLLNYALSGSDRMTSSGNASKTGKGVSRYEFSRYFDGTQTSIEMDYIRPMPYGWYISALLAGGLTIAIILLATRQKKQKTTLLERFPYNPEEYRDYEDHLPTKRQ